MITLAASSEGLALIFGQLTVEVAVESSLKESERVYQNDFNEKLHSLSLSLKILDYPNCQAIDL